MKIVITNSEENVGTIKDFSDLDRTKLGLIGQLIAELELLKEELLGIYVETE